MIKNQIMDDQKPSSTISNGMETTNNSTKGSTNKLPTQYVQ